MYKNAKCSDPVCDDGYYGPGDYGKKAKCDLCGKPLVLTDITNPEDLIQIADDNLENANRHGINAADCWNGISKFVPEDKQLEAAEALLKFFDSIC